MPRENVALIGLCNDSRWRVLFQICQFLSQPTGCHLRGHDLCALIRSDQSISYHAVSIICCASWWRVPMRISSICTKEEFVNSRPSLEIFQYVCMHGLSLIPLTGGVPGTSTQYQKVVKFSLLIQETKIPLIERWKSNLPKQGWPCIGWLCC